uniref:hypothetical protein n=1 Tax=Pedobacter schmidteae TaxID=2201271 RepID=UPI000EB24F15|nr:hypothetical protein [Pedobacter schmidteae]
MNLNNQSSSYIFSLASIEDIPFLVKLNSEWQLSNISSDMKSEGFLSAKFNASDFEKLIKNEEVVIASFSGIVVGYYLLNNFCETIKYHEGQKVILNLIDRNKIKNRHRIGIGAQSVIEKQHQGKGLSRFMLKLLCESVCAKYDFLYSSISKQNIKAYQIHTKEGWFVADEDDSCHYVLLNPGSVM